MAEHSQLTGAALHEPKGIAAASANRAYISDGVGSGSWATVTNDALADTAKAFQGQLLQIVDEKSSGTAGGSMANNTWVTRTLNTVKTNEITGASLASNRITLPAGTYWVECSVPAYAVDEHKARLYNVTDVAATLYGTAERSTTTTPSTTRSIIRERFTISSQKVFEIQHYGNTSKPSSGLGVATAIATIVERYTDVCIWKVA